jgi:Zn-dependent protease with chaperone function
VRTWHLGVIALQHILLTLASLASLEICSADPAMRLPASGGVLLASLLAGGGLIKLSMRGLLLRYEPAEVLERFTRLRQRMSSCWPLVYPGLLWLLGWTHCLHALRLDGCASALLVLLLFVPQLIAVLILELVSAQLEDVAYGTVAGSSWPEHWKLRLRLGEFSGWVFCLLPMLCASAAYDALEHIWSGSSDGITSALAGLLGCGVLPVIFPFLLARWMGVRELEDSALAGRVELLRCRSGIGPWAVRQIASDQWWAGAAIVGWLPRTRQLWLGDELTKLLGPQELDMVILHEIAHIKQRHFYWRFVPLLCAAAVALLAYMGFACWATELLPAWLVTLACTVIAAVAFVLGLADVSHHCELEADRVACRLAASICAWTLGDTLPAAQALGSALVQLTHPSVHADHGSWLHPSLRQRLGNLAALLAEQRVSGEGFGSPKYSALLSTAVKPS